MVYTRWYMDEFGTWHLVGMPNTDLIGRYVRVCDWQSWNPGDIPMPTVNAIAGRTYSMETPPCCVCLAHFEAVGWL